jgi:hypothetical protein
MVVGDRQWQILLLLVSRIRILILTGDLPVDAMPSIPMLLSAMRQRIDVVIGTPASVGSLPTGFHERWLVRRTLIVPDDVQRPPPPMPDSDQVLHLPDDVRLAVLTSPLGFWLGDSAAAKPTMASLITISRGHSIIAIAKDLETIAQLTPPTTAVAIAPGGSIDHLARHLGVPAICINADLARDQDIALAGTGETAEVTRFLVRIFREDVADLRLSDNGVTIPEWRQAVL